MHISKKTASMLFIFSIIFSLIAKCYPLLPGCQKLFLLFGTKVNVLAIYTLIFTLSKITGEENVMLFIEPPKIKNPLLKFLIWIGDKGAGKKMMPSRILAWYPRALINSGIFESLVTHSDRSVSKRILKLVRMTVSFTVSCPFCIDMNSWEFEKMNISEEEIEALQEVIVLDKVTTLNEREKTAIRYARAICSTPIAFDETLIADLKNLFDEREIVILASTASQVNYWTRLIQSFGITPAGFHDNCPILKLDKYAGD